MAAPPAPSRGRHPLIPMLFTVAVCTWNRCASLERMLQTLAAADRSGLDLEVLVVDNGSSDDTARVVHAAASVLPIRLVTEPERGVANARNTAVREARGDVIVWTDDDVLVDRDWLQAHARAVARWPGAGFYGGAIRPLFAYDPPDWMTANWQRISGVYGARDLGQMPFLFDDRCLPYSGNLVVHTHIMRRYPFDPRLGPRGTGRLGGEETPVLRAMIADRIRGWWVPDAAVQHLVPAERMTLSYLGQIYASRGAARRLDDGSAHIPGVRPWIWAMAQQAERAYRASRAVDPPEIWLPLFLRVCVARGRMR